MCDPGTEFQGDFAEHLAANGCAQLITDPRAPLQNGRTERAIQEVGGMIRTLKFALEERTGGEKIALGHPVVPWLAKHAAAQITRYQVRSNGRTSY